MNPKIQELLDKVEKEGPIPLKAAADFLGHKVSFLVRSGMLEQFAEPNPLHHLGGRGVKIMRQMVRRTSKAYDPMQSTKNLPPPPKGGWGGQLKYPEQLQRWAKKHGYAVIKPADVEAFSDGEELAAALIEIASAETDADSSYMLREAATHLIGLQNILRGIMPTCAPDRPAQH